MPAYGAERSEGRRRASVAATVSVAKPTPAMSAAPDLAWHNLSFFHGDGERLAFARDGRVFYERLKADRLLRREVTLEASDAATLAAIQCARLSSAGAVAPERMGIPMGSQRARRLSRQWRQASARYGLEADWGSSLRGTSFPTFATPFKRLSERMNGIGPGTLVAPDAGANWPPAFPAR